ncbi:Eda 2-keto-3-deoxy-6-phosphogluconate aldolase [Rhabdaerophilaceae bacterium]
MSDHIARFDAAFHTLPLIAILRGIRPDEAIRVAEALFDAGIRIIEVPLNSPSPFESIARLVSVCGERGVVGAGTVRRIEEVERLREIGAGLVLSPHVDADIVRQTVGAGMVSVPGILSPTEAFAGLNAGAHALKLFPMEMIGIAGARAFRAVLPPSTRLIGVGGVSEANTGSMLAGACDGVGIGSALYRPGDSIDTLADRARRFVSIGQTSRI